MIVASSYTKYDTYAINQLGNVQLLRYQRYEEGTLALDSLTEPLATKGKKAVTASAGTGAPHGEYGLEYHLARTSESAREAFLALRDRILALEGVEERADQKSQITYRTTKSFAAFAFQKHSVQCQFKGADSIDDPEQHAKDIKSYEWGYQWVCDLKSLADVDAVFALVKGAYELEQ